MSFAILGMGTAVPPTAMSQAEACRVARALCCRTTEQETWLPLVYDHSGIRNRHSTLGLDVVQDVLQGTRSSGSVFLPTGKDDDRGPTTAQRLRHYAEHATPLALQAGRRALADAGLRPGAVTHLVTISCTGFRAPGIDIGLIKGLGLPAGTQRTHVGFMGCHGALNALRVADAFTGADPGARVLVCATELCSLHYYYGWDPQKIVANALFADGSAAAVGAAAAASPAGAWRVAAAGSCLFPDSEDAMTWTVGDHGFEMTLSKQVPGLIAAHLRPWLEGWLVRNGASRAEVVSWAVHPGGPRILDAVEEALGLGREATAAARNVLADHGNMSSPTLLFILDRLRRLGAGLPCVALGFGPGLVAEAVLLR
jgi:prepilin-type processing-associated H-X9-DG protein